MVPPECGFTERLTFLVHDTCLQVRKWGASVPIPGVVFWHERHTCLLSKLGRLTHYFIFFLHPLTCPLKPAWYSANGFVTGSCGYEGIEYCRKQYIIVVAGFCIFSAMIAVMDIETPKRKHFDVNISISHQWALKHLMYINC